MIEMRNSPDLNRANSERQRARWQDPAYRARMAVATKNEFDRRMKVRLIQLGSQERRNEEQ